jgi:hypothetical protein
MTDWKWEFDRLQQKNEELEYRNRQLVDDFNEKRDRVSELVRMVDELNKIVDSKTNQIKSLEQVNHNAHLIIEDKNRFMKSQDAEIDRLNKKNNELQALMYKIKLVDREKLSYPDLCGPSKLDFTFRLTPWGEEMLKDTINHYSIGSHYNKDWTPIKSDGEKALEETKRLEERINLQMKHLNDIEIKLMDMPEKITMEVIKKLKLRS